MKLKAQRQIGDVPVCAVPADEKEGTIRVKPSTFNNAFGVKASVYCPTCDCERVNARTVGKTHKPMSVRCLILFSLFVVSLTDSCHKRSQMSWQWRPCVWKVSVSRWLVRHKCPFKLLLTDWAAFAEHLAFIPYSVCVSPSGSAHSATVQRFPQIWPPTCAKALAWMSLVQDGETARRVELVCVTTRSSMRDPTASTTGLSVSVTEAFSATVQRNCHIFHTWRGVTENVLLLNKHIIVLFILILLPKNERIVHWNKAKRLNERCSNWASVQNKNTVL